METMIPPAARPPLVAASPDALFGPAGFFGAPLTDPGQPVADLLRRALHVTREHFGMELAFISELRDGQRILRFVDAAPGLPIEEGATISWDGTYCARIVDGRLPAMVRDTAQCAEAAALDETRKVPIGAFLAVPIRLDDGAVYGTFCCASTRPDPTLNQRDAQTMKLLAQFVAGVLQKHLEDAITRDAIARRIRGVLQRQDFEIVYQPIFAVNRHKLAGYEALTRFHGEAARTPDVWFQEASAVGLLEELEVAVLQKALQEFTRVPSNVYLSLNVSPSTILNDALGPLLHRKCLKRLVLEVTEHASVEDYVALTAKLAPLRQLGLRLAVDDAGAGFASFRHILKMRPDDIKLDISLVRKIDRDLNARALAASLIRYARETGSKVVAEGVESASVLQVLKDLRVDKAQGFFIGRPGPLPAAPHATTGGTAHA
jgi:EAL domain-containing protein (putative c-di-GMP-specific phosphodiesterase class I)